jgi:regulator of replication initiation timing
VAEPRRASTDEETLLEDVRTRFQWVQEVEADWRRRAEEDMKFAAGEQWDSALLQHRTGRPSLVIDRMGTTLRQLINEGRQQRPGITVSPMDSVADPDTANKIQGLIRNVEVQSNADMAYATGLEHGIICGRGFLRVNTRYIDDSTFAQEAYIERIRNPLWVYLDPMHTQPDGSDAKWCFIAKQMTRREYEGQYGRNTATLDGWAALDTGWVTPQVVRVAEYFWAEKSTITLRMYSTGEIVTAGAPEPAGARVTGTREVERWEVWQAVTNGHEILSQTRWRGTKIPIAQVIGEEAEVDGKPDWRGLVRRLRDPQRQYNFWQSSKAEMIALAPKSPFIGAEGQFEGHPEWATANLRNHAFLEYKLITSMGGQPLPPPQRSSVEPPVQAMVQGSLQAADEIKAISGYYDPSLGAQSNETSGVAIRQRQAQTNTATYHFLDNQRRAIRYIGEILVDLFPHIMTEPQTVRILGEDGQASQTLFNERHTDPTTGEAVLYDLSTGRYDVAIEAGPSYATQRQENAQVLTQIVQAAPQLMMIVGDMLLESLDVDLAAKMAERMRKAMPPALLMGEEGSEKELAVAQAQQQLQQMPALQQQLQQAQAQLAQMNQSVQSLTTTNNQLTLQLTNREQELSLQARKIAAEEQDKTRQRVIDEQEAMIAAYKAETERLKATMTAAETDVEGGPYAPRNGTSD